MPYPYESRSALARYFFGINRTVNFAVKVTVGSFAATVPLVTLGHVSNATDGEGFVRTVYYQAENFPLFLVKADGSNSVVSGQFSVKASDQYQSGAGAIIQTAQTVIKAVAPQSAVVTTLSAQATKDAATAIDGAINKLLARSIDEEPWIDNDIRRWGAGVSVTFSIPFQEGAWDQAYGHVGTWTITFDYPRPSIFSDVQICPVKEQTTCKANFTAAAMQAQTDTAKRPEQVLAFQLLNGAQTLGTVEAYLKQQDFWTTAQKAFQAKEGVKADDVSQFCRSIRNSMATLNLNYIDSGIVVVSVRKSSALTSAVADLMEKDKVNCGYESRLNG